VDGQCTIDGLNPTGAVSDGLLTVAGRVRRATLIRYDSEHSVVWEGQIKDLKSAFIPDTRLGKVDIQTTSGDTLSTVQRTDSYSAGDAPFTALVGCLIVADLPHGEGSPISDDFDVYYMVVLGLSRQVAGPHERIGMLQVYPRPEIGVEWLSSAKIEEVTNV